MSRIDELNRRYAASASLERSGVEIVAVGDPRGARLNVAVRRLLLAVRDDGPGLWDDLVGAANGLRWRLVTQPLPLEHSPLLRDGAGHVAQQVGRLRGAVANQALLDELAAAAAAVAESDPVVGGALLHRIEDAGFDECVVVAASQPARVGLESWLGARGARVLTVGELEREQPRVDAAYVVGPPRFFKSSVVTAPLTSGVTFLMPAWFGDRAVPRSAIAPYAEGAIRIHARVVSEGDVGAPEGDAPDVDVDDEFLPQPVWGTRQSPDLEPTNGEVEVHKVLLSGNLAIWLDDGDRIRALDPTQPVGERVIYTGVSAVRAGTYLLLRQGETGRGALLEAAMGLLGARRSAVDATQRAWKSCLAERLSELGYREVMRQLRAEGVRSAERARAWTEPTLIRPSSDHEFESVLEWLGIPIQPTFGHATWLRRMHHQASTDLREELEAAVSVADLSVLERDGLLSLAADTERIRGIVATRVLAISPHTEIVARYEARVPFEDRSGQWLE